MKELMKRRCIPFLQSYARIEREKAIEDFDRKMKLWRWIHDTSDNAPPPGFQQQDENDDDDEPPVKSFKQGRHMKAVKEVKEVIRRRRGPRPKNVDQGAKQSATTVVPTPTNKTEGGDDEVIVTAAAAIGGTAGGGRWKNRNQREETKRVSKPSRIIRERIDSGDWVPDAAPQGTKEGEHKRIRLTYSEEQVEMLREAFDAEHYASREVKEELSERTGLSVTQVNKWFENRRKRERDERKARGEI
ncbi:hypothetical protein QR680_001197 [Steinernema hermaphroditum]|uniref:Homeobox domain-containing protein n=1 Tax=Steinernema hermaphroditum TaxID=289476 RepID=A0AA39GXA8_9BILA|nr:hypothetical protein QR680_001197 [Steinernema hermaphroditum]